MAEDSSGMYMAAMRDLVNGSGDSIAARAFIGDLMAQRAFIDNLLTRLIVVKDQGAIQSEIFVPGQLGFLIQHNGDVEFNRGIFRDIQITGESFFSGNIMSGPLELLSSTPQGTERNFPAGTSATAISDRLGRRPETAVQGTFRGITINAVFYSTSRVRNIRGSITTTDVYTDIHVRFTNNTREHVARHRHRTIVAPILVGFPPQFAGHTHEIQHQNIQTLSHPLNFRYTLTGRTFRLLDLPRGSSDESTVWKDENNFLRIGPRLT